MAEAEEIIGELKKLARSDYRERMSRFGIDSQNALGVPVPEIRKLSKKFPHTVVVSRKLWATGIHEAMILSTMVFPPAELTAVIANEMVGDIKSWDVCDHFTGNLVANSSPALVIELADTWGSDRREYVRRAAFSLIASVDHSLMYGKENVQHFLCLIRDASDDGRNFVKKAVDWALREIGKSSNQNRLLALAAAEDILNNGSKAGRWIGDNARRELTSKKITDRLSGN